MHGTNSARDHIVLSSWDVGFPRQDGNLLLTVLITTSLPPFFIVKVTINRGKHDLLGKYICICLQGVS